MVLVADLMQQKQVAFNIHIDPLRVLSDSTVHYILLYYYYLLTIQVQFSVLACVSQIRLDKPPIDSSNHIQRNKKQYLMNIHCLLNEHASQSG